jgi:hypothetical protein
VHVHLYDLSESFAQINAVSIDIIGFGGGLHTGVEVYGREWSFGTGGVSCSVPKKNKNYVYRQTVPMGATDFTSREVDLAIAALQSEWRGADYDLFTRNCGTFCNTLCVRLDVGNLPTWITRLAEAGGKSSTVRRIADMMVHNGLLGEASPNSSCQQGCSGSEYGSPLPVRNIEASHEFSPVEQDSWMEEEATPADFSMISPLQENASGDGRSTSRKSCSTQDTRKSCSTQDTHRVQVVEPLRAMSYDDGSSYEQGQLSERRCSSGRGSAPGSRTFKKAAIGGA